MVRFRQDRPRQKEVKPPAQSWTMPQYSDISDVQLRRLELEHEREQEREKGQRQERERERERERQQQFEL